MSRSRHSSSGGASITSSVAAGGFVPYSSFVRKQPTMTSSPSVYVSSLWSSSLTGQGGSADLAPPKFCSAHQVGSPAVTAWTINERGNRVWLKYEHQPTLFPVQETRFYKPKLHKRDFLGKNKDKHGSAREL